MSRRLFTRSLFLLLFPLLLPAFDVLAQDFSYIHYGTKDGLARSTTYGISQDKEGFIWFGTETGLSRFDGTNFRNFTMADGLPSNEIFGIYTDSRNLVWMNCLKNAVCYYHNGQIHNQQNDPVLKKIVLRGRLTAIGENPAGDIMIYSVESSFIIRADGTTVEAPGYSADRQSDTALFHAVYGLGAFPVRRSRFQAILRHRLKENAEFTLTPAALYIRARRWRYPRRSRFQRLPTASTSLIFLLTETVPVRKRSVSFIKR